MRSSAPAEAGRPRAEGARRPFPPPAGKRRVLAGCEVHPARRRLLHDHDQDRTIRVARARDHGREEVRRVLRRALRVDGHRAADGSQHLHHPQEGRDAGRRYHRADARRAHAASLAAVLQRDGCGWGGEKGRAARRQGPGCSHRHPDHRALCRGRGPAGGGAHAVPLGAGRCDARARRPSPPARSAGTNC